MVSAFVILPEGQRWGYQKVTSWLHHAQYSSNHFLSTPMECQFSLPPSGHTSSFVQTFYYISYSICACAQKLQEPRNSIHPVHVFKDHSTPMHREYLRMFASGRQSISEEGKTEELGAIERGKHETKEEGS